MKILIAEDDAVSRTILRRAVESLGYECLAAPDGELAWELYEATPNVDVIISDRMMPGADGLDLCRRLRAHPRESYTFFIFLTELGDRGHLLEGMKCGADDYLTKPLDREELEARLGSAGRVLELHELLLDKQRQLESLNVELFSQSRRDPLTRLGNRLQLREDIETFDAQASRYGYAFSALLCDIDHFKLYNDHHGHLAGDDALQEVAGAISRAARAGDSLYRYGGEEFLVILPAQNAAGAQVAAQRLRESMRELGLQHGVTGGVVSLSVGVSSLDPGEEKGMEALIREADEALYEAKRRGRDRVEVYGRGAG